MKRSSPYACLFTMLMSGAGVARAQGPLHGVMLVYRATNRDQVEATSVTAHCILPASNRYQQVADVQVDPEPSQEYVDGEGQRVVTVPLGRIPPGHTRAVRVLAWVRLKRLTVLLVRTGRQVEPLSPEIKQAHLQDGQLLQLAKVQAIAKQAIGDNQRDLDQARALYNYMIQHCRYGMDAKVDTADAVLGGERASCSELAYTYVALCRSVGIPARTVSAFVQREETPPSVDWRSHRWAEFYAEGIGWVPVDPTNKLNRPSGNFFGQQRGKYLTVLDDGVVSSSGPDPGWLAFLVRPEPETVQLVLGRSAAWRTSTHRQKETAFFKQACDVLRQTDPAARRQAIEQWNHPPNPLDVAFLLEALFDADAEVRRTAAVALGRSNDVTVTLALMDRAETEPDINVLKALLDAVRRFLADPDDERRATVVSKLAKSRTDHALKLLDGIWDDQPRAVRKMAAQMLYKFGDKPAVHEAYRELVDDEDEFIRLLAALRWARVGSHEALDLLVGHLESENSWDREKALAELENRTGDDFGFNPRLGPDSRRNRDAINKFRDWLDEHPDTK